MYDRILLPTDGSDAAAAALDAAVDVAAAHDATLHVLYVADTNQPSLARIRGRVVDVLESEGESVVEAAAERARRSGVRTETAVVQGGPARTVLDYVDDRGVDLVVMGRRGLGAVERLLLGSVTERVVRRCAVPVLVVPEDGHGEYPPADVLVGLDGSDGADAALDEALAVASDADGTLHLVTVIDRSVLGVDVRSSAAAEERDRRAEELLAAAGERADEAGVASVAATLEAGSVVDGLDEYVRDQGVDLVVVGTHGRSSVDRRLLGSVTEGLLRTAAAPVLSVRTAADE